MIQVRVAGVALDPTGQHVILLKPMDEVPGEGRLLPIWIGQQEATSILIAVEGAIVPRPLAHDLMRSLLESVDASVTGVAVTRIEEGTFYAEITMSTTRGQRIVDARPSDAVALASRVSAPIWVAEAVMDDAGVPDNLTENDDETVLEADIEPGPEAEERLDEFKRFLEDVDPEDFRG
ncbi:bifunctional nuclease family protein [Microbacterium sp.]|uniref:bifunctional nuclease family protein n=1 Tax=Microbacterium sp. TaxID=51671 RepID=UPI002E36B866|nr:bifunctional nuclease family protein [Microbacterium sp.]HEX5729136.1 bifunctional nuclease family protein [Microbacterium sp.]